jgi:hypothetical protein
MNWTDAFKQQVRQIARVIKYWRVRRIEAQLERDEARYIKHHNRMRDKAARLRARAALGL